MISESEKEALEEALCSVLASLIVSPFERILPFRESSESITLRYSFGKSVYITWCGIPTRGWWAPGNRGQCDKWTLEGTGLSSCSIEQLETIYTIMQREEILVLDDFIKKHYNRIMEQAKLLSL